MSETPINEDRLEFEIIIRIGNNGVMSGYDATTNTYSAPRDQEMWTAWQAMMERRTQAAPAELAELKAMWTAWQAMMERRTQAAPAELAELKAWKESAMVQLAKVRELVKDQRYWEWDMELPGVEGAPTAEPPDMPLLAKQLSGEYNFSSQADREQAMRMGKELYYGGYSDGQTRAAEGAPTGKAAAPEFDCNAEYRGPEKAYLYIDDGCYRLSAQDVDELLESVTFLKKKFEAGEASPNPPVPTNSEAS